MDERFAHLASDPRFRSMPKKDQKVKIDKRFSSMFHDKKFKIKYSTDKRGRPVNNSTSEDLKRYYDISTSEDEGSSSDSEKDNKDHSESSDDSDQNDTSELISSNPKVQKLKNKKQQDSSNEDEKDTINNVDLARGVGNVETSSSEEEDSSEDSEEEDGEMTHKWGELDKEAPQTEDISKRLAICNMDWDRIKAGDLFVLANSFKPTDGVIKSVKIYPSDYGIERLKEEEVRGPAELVQETLKSDDEDYAQTNEGSKYHMEKLRKYQLNRLKYFYAIMECDTPETASKLYEELDGMEYESSASQLDLRFVPDDVNFDHEPTSICDALPDLATYQPLLFTTTALQQASVQLTWDETNPDRQRTVQKAFSSVEEVEADLKTYLASSSEDEGILSENADNAELPQSSILTSTKPEAKRGKGSGSTIEKYKALLMDLEEEEKKSKDRDVTLEISWEPGLKGKAESLLKKREKMKDATPFEEFLEKKKEKKKIRKELKKEVSEKESDNNSSDEDNNHAFSDDDMPDDIDLNDPFFKEELQNTRMEKKNKKNRKKPTDFGNDNVEDEESKAQLELLMMDDEDHLNGNKHFNLKNLLDPTSKSKVKREKKKMRKMKNFARTKNQEDEFNVDVTDPRFSAIYESALYNIDPSDTHYKKTKGMQIFVQEKFKRKAEDSTSSPSKVLKPDTENSKPKINPSLSLLVNSIKSKSNKFGKK